MTPADQTQRERLARIEAPEPTYCALGVGCDEYGVCYAEIHMQPEQCGRRAMPEPLPEQYLGVEWHSSETVEPREIRISLRDVLATIGIFSLLAIAAVGFMAVGN